MAGSAGATEPGGAQPAARRDPRVGRGVVVAFDDDAGLGRIAAEAGPELAFHCTAVADGSRFVAPGTSVAFQVVAAHGGGWEAGAVVVA